MCCHGYVGLNVIDLHAIIGSGTREGQLFWSGYVLVRESMSVWGWNLGFLSSEYLPVSQSTFCCLQDARPSVTPPSPCLLACCPAPHHGNNGLNL